MPEFFIAYKELKGFLTDTFELMETLGIDSLLGDIKLAEANKTKLDVLFISV